MKKEQQNIVAPMQNMMQQAGPRGDDKPEASGPLGLDAEGGAGSDGGGLAGRKGGKDVITLGSGFGKGGGGGDQAALMRQYAWYNQFVQDEVKKVVRRRLDDAGGIPKGRFEATIRIVLDDGGDIANFRITHSTGNQAVDDAVRECLERTRMSKPPPQGIPRCMNIRITCQG
jgi:TonB family protein